LAAETGDHLTGLSRWNWIRQAKADYTLVFSISEHERGSGFHPILGIGLAIRRSFGGPDLTPLESFLFTNRNRAESEQPTELETV